MGRKTELMSRYATGVPEWHDPTQEATVIGSAGQDFGYGAVCTSHARYIAHMERKARIMGFSCEDNPCDMSELAEGHDFAVIKDRFIVDTWLCHWEGAITKPVLDMKDKDDMALIRKWCGNPELWVEVAKKVDSHV